MNVRMQESPPSQPRLRLRLQRPPESHHCTRDFRRMLFSHRCQSTPPSPVARPTATASSTAFTFPSARSNLAHCSRLSAGTNAPRPCQEEKPRRCALPKTNAHSAVHTPQGALQAETETRAALAAVRSQCMRRHPTQRAHRNTPTSAALEFISAKETERRGERRF